MKNNNKKSEKKTKQNEICVNKEKLKRRREGR